jgi:predicted CoA-binding protein
MAAGRLITAEQDVLRLARAAKRVAVLGCATEQKASPLCSSCFPAEDPPSSIGTPPWVRLGPSLWARCVLLAPTMNNKRCSWASSIACWLGPGKTLLRYPPLTLLCVPLPVPLSLSRALTRVWCGAQADRPAFFVAQYLADAGVEVVPVPVYYPDVTHILGREVYRTVAAVPDSASIDIVTVFRR